MDFYYGRGLNNYVMYQWGLDRSGENEAIAADPGGRRAAVLGREGRMPGVTNNMRPRLFI